MMKAGLIDNIYELSPLQQGLLFDVLKRPELGFYIEQVTIPFDGFLDLAALRAAWEDVVQQHAALRTSFHWEDLDKPVQVVHPVGRLEFVEVRLDGEGTATAEERAQQWLLEDRRRGFELDSPPLMRVSVLCLPNERHVVVWSFHHLLLDGWSTWNVLKAVTESYARIVGGQRVRSAPPRPFSDYIAWLRRQDESEAQTHWRACLADFERPNDLPFAQPTDARAKFQEAEHRLSVETTARLQSLARSRHLTMNTVLQGAWALLVSHYASDLDVVYGSVVSGRPPELAGVESMVGMFINTLPVRVKVDPDAELLDWLTALQQQLASMRRFEFSSLAEAQQCSGCPSGTPLFHSLFAYENYAADSAATGDQPDGAPLGPGFVGRTSYPVTVTVSPGHRLLLKAMYFQRDAEAGRGERLLEHLGRLLEGFADAPERRLSDFVLLSEAEREQALGRWSAAPTAYPRDASMTGLFAEVVERFGDRVALTTDAVSVTYTQLDAWSGEIAAQLRDGGVERGDFVGICAERSPEVIAGLLGILKAGGAYLPLDPGDPAERRRVLARDAGISIALVQEAHIGALRAAAVEELSLGGPAAALDRPVQTLQALGPEDLAYALHTSGSTGQPKGVCVCHRSVIRLVRGANFAQIDDGEVFLQLAPLSFDASTLEIWGPLLNGGRLVIAPPEQPSIAELVDLVARHGVTTLWLTAGLFHQVIDTDPLGLRSLRQLLAGGDRLSPPHVKRAFEQLPSTRLVNGYGPTENTTFSTFHVITEADAASPVPIGRPISNSTVFILDVFGHPCPVGVVGEIHVGGDGLAVGYLNRQEADAAAFVRYPDIAEGARLYRTGDLGFQRQDGVIEFVGRRDRQMKVRGFRIEAGEVESALMADENIRSCVVEARVSRFGDKSLVAWIVWGEGADTDLDAVRETLLATLPPYAVPSHFVPLDELPLTPNGKVDRRALPAPGAQVEDGESVSPRSEIEEILAEIWAEVLDLDQVGVNRDFFTDLGGHSLDATRAVSRIRGRFELDLSLQTFFDNPRIDVLAFVIEDALLKELEDPEAVAAGTETTMNSGEQLEGGSIR